MAGTTLKATLAATALVFAASISGAVAEDRSSTSSDPLSDLEVLPASELGISAGTGIDIGAIGLNLATNTGTVAGTTMVGDFDTGQISSNAISDVRGINSMMFNTGNNVNFQSNMQVNVFLQ